MNAFEPLNVDFDQQSLYNDLMSTDMFDKSFLATAIYTDGRSMYDDDVTHYDEHRNIIENKYKTFVNYNFTHIPGISETENTCYLDTPTGRSPIWHVYDTEWTWKDDTPQSLIDIVDKFNLSYISCVRLVGQTPPSKGIVHADARYRDNLKYFKNGGVAITLNVSDGGGHLQYRVGKEMYTVDESKYKCWHFDDSMPHCTTEIFSPRVQIRIFGRK